MADDADNTEVNACLKVDVTLCWKDFFYALEESRHQCQEDVRNRDWFKLNPLEIVFLGCESVMKNEFVKQKLGTIMVGMENITSDLCKMPRMFDWMMEILTDQMSSDTCSVYMWQKCWKLLFGMRLAVKQNLRLYLYAVKMVQENCDQLLKGSCNQPVNIRNQVEELINELKQRQKTALEISETLNIGAEVKIDIALQVFLESLRCENKTGEVGDEEEGSNGKKFEEIKRVFNEASSSIRKWIEHDKDESRIPSKILAYLFVAICSTDFSIEEADRFLETARISSTLNALMMFAKEGERSKLSTEIFEWALELMMSSCETGVRQPNVLLAHLQNLLGPVFGYNDARIVRKALEYGSLALRSRHQKSLLGEGIWFMRKAHSQFKSRDVMRADVKKCQLRIDAVSTAKMLIGIILTAVFQNDDEGIANKIYNEEHGSEFAQGNDADGTILSEEDNTELQHFEMFESGLGDREAACENEIHEILYLMYELACSIVKNGENICYTFASVLPKLFQPTYLPEIAEDLSRQQFTAFQTAASHIPWRVNKNYLAIKVLKFCTDCTKYRSSTSFQICSVMIPKLVANLDRTELSDTQKLAALIEFIDTCQSKANQHEAVNALIGYGIDLISLLMPKGLDVRGLKDFLPQMLKSLEKILSSTSLLFLRNSCNFFMSNFPSENEQLKGLFFKLLQKGKKNEIRNIHLLSAAWITHPRFRFVLASLYKYGDGILKPRQLQSLCEILTCMVDVEKKLREQLKEHLQSQDIENIRTVHVWKFTQPLLAQLQDVLDRNAFDGDTQKLLMDKVSYLTLYSAFYPDDILQQLLNSDEDQPPNISADIPRDVFEDVELMKLLLTSARRIEHMSLPRFHALKLLLTDILKGFLNDEQGRIESRDSAKREDGELPRIEADVMPTTGRPAKQERGPKSQTDNRKSRLDLYLQEMQTNRKILQRLQDCGYKLANFDDDVEITVQTTGSLNVEENLRQTLLASFNGYTELLKQLGVPVVKIDGKDVKIHEIFSDELTLTDLKGRRAVVVKAIEKHASREQQSQILDRKLSLLSDEERIESEMEAKASAKLRSKAFKARLNISFFDCAACCGPQIVGCYAPNGDHCERPLEIGMRCDSAFASIYDENDVEIENAEMLFMDQGAFVFRAYSNGHPFDTSQVWVAFFEELLEKREMVPALILAHHMPNRHTWETIRRTASTALTGNILSGEFDFSTEWRSYYDWRPESVRCGKDIVLIRGFKSSKNRPELQRQFSVSNSKDLGGLIFDNVMQNLVNDETLHDFRFLGSAIAEYISDLTETGEESSHIIFSQFNFERWLKARRQTEEPMKKTAIVGRICDLIRFTVDEFIDELDLGEMFEKRRRQFFQLKRFLEKRKPRKEDTVKKNITSEICHVLKRNTGIQHIEKLPLNVQEEVMHWIFGNEDRVWRYRGGRDGYETIHQYLRFLNHIRNETAGDQTLPAFPGVLILVKRGGRFHTESLQVKDIAGYAVGEYVDELDSTDDQQEDDTVEESTAPKHYEIVTAWVNPDYRRLNLSTQLYLEIFKSVTSPTVAFDVIKGSTSKVIRSSPVLKFLQAILPISVTIRTQNASYNVISSVAEEQFERLIVNRRPVQAAVMMHEKMIFLLENKYFIIMPVLICLAAILVGQFVSYIF